SAGRTERRGRAFAGRYIIPLTSPREISRPTLHVSWSSIAPDQNARLIPCSERNAGASLPAHLPRSPHRSRYRGTPNSRSIRPIDPARGRLGSRRAVAARSRSWAGRVTYEQQASTAGVAELPPLRGVIRRHAAKPKKSVRQNFPFALNPTARIGQAAEPPENI